MPFINFAAGSRSESPASSAGSHPFDVRERNEAPAAGADLQRFVAWATEQSGARIGERAPLTEVGGYAVVLRLSVPGVTQFFKVVPAAGLLPDRVALLARHAEQEGIRVVSTLRERWEDESERYGGQGEAVLAAVASGEVVGVGGLSHCPHVDGALRMRRFYVAPEWRRRGVARSLAAELITTGHVYADVITCNARASVAAAPFWESVGFIPVDAEGITHVHRS